MFVAAVKSLGRPLAKALFGLKTGSDMAMFRVVLFVPLDPS